MKDKNIIGSIALILVIMLTIVYFHGKNMYNSGYEESYNLYGIEEQEITFLLFTNCEEPIVDGILPMDTEISIKKGYEEFCDKRIIQRIDLRNIYASSGDEE